MFKIHVPIDLRVSSEGSSYVQLLLMSRAVMEGIHNTDTRNRQRRMPEHNHVHASLTILIASIIIYFQELTIT